ncbi:hypothetical protein DFH11DRAFT_1687800 [Phellopilus nigrolimitatus]|nr:hypothetical protein DFH11DRAFT_1687800 [Phellopilus nigrolimitatus]
MMVWTESLGNDSETRRVGRLASLVSTPDPVRNLDPANPASHLSKILIPRPRECCSLCDMEISEFDERFCFPADSANNTLVKNYIVSTLRKLNWDIEEDSFTDNTPYGTKRFTNVIATKDPEASRRVILAAHFDSKFFSTYPQNQFVGATDSAVPSLDPLLNRRKEQLDNGLLDDEDVADTTLQLVFFDGEEAFKDWTATDSVYGARHLAQRWATTYIPPNTKRRLRTTATELSTIEHLILLDLLGAKNPLIQSYFLDTAWRSFFAPRTDMQNHGYIEDDHIPFMRLGVSILHVISSPFPRVWHTLEDDASALDLETMKRWNLIMRVFMCEYLGLQPDARESAIARDNGDLPLHMNHHSIEL